MISSPAARSALALGVAALALVACAKLPPGAKVDATQPGATAGESQHAGTNQMGEPCRFEASADVLGGAFTAAYNVYCGTWQQPSGRIFEGAAPGGADTLQRLAVSSPWRVALNEIVDCDEPSAAKVLSDAPAELMRCSRKSGDWPHLALVADVSGKTYFVDGVPSALPALETALATLSGQAAPSADQSSKMAEISAAISSHPFGSGDLDAYFTLMRLGNAANDGSNYAAAEQAFRSALAVQERILGPSDPGLATPIMNLALQISNQGRYLEADQLFARADQLVTESADPLEKARYDLYIAEHETNRSNLTEAEASNAIAEREYLELVPASLVDAARGFTETRGNSYTDALMLGPDGQNAIAGLAASWTLGALIAYRNGDYARVQVLNNSIDGLLRLSGLRPPGLEPRAVRLAALGDAHEGAANEAVTRLNTAAQLFARYGENERPVAVTLFLAGRSALAGGKPEEALALFRKGAAMARSAHLGLPEALVGEYLQAIDQTAAAAAGDRETYAAEMFQASQLIQGNVTGQVVAQALARLAAGDVATRDLLRQMQDADLKLQQLYAARDQETRLPAAQVDQHKIAKIDAEIAATQAARADADSAAQAASPDYAQLVSKEASATEVQNVLAAHEGLVSFVVGGTVTFGILVEKNRIAEYRVALSPFELAKAVAQLRATIVPSGENGEVALPVFDVGAAHRLYEKLFGPVEERLNALERLVIVPSGALTSLPLEVLVTDDTPPVTDGNYKNVPFLIKRLAINYVPAPQTLVVLRDNTKPSSAPNPYIGFGDFQPATRAQIAASYPPSTCTRDFLSLVDLPPLPGTRKEIDAVGRLVFHVKPQDMVLGAGFTKAALTGTDLTQFRIVHLATHALLPSELRCRSEPLIALSADPAATDASSAFLGLSEVLSIKLDADLVLLSACNTAGPGGSAGDALSGLAKAFFFAGARGLMVTHWELEDTAGPVLTALTLSQWGAARDSAADLRRAKLYMIVALGSKPGPSFAFFTHPFAWAPFVLIGDGIRAAAPSS